MTIALAMLALMIVILFSGLTLGALRQDKSEAVERVRKSLL
ncbi:hypothetical protein [Hoeflea olei]|nr:hypothetical protein [Hoeflea olei]